jgi:hypothetical protein
MANTQKKFGLENTDAAATFSMIYEPIRKAFSKEKSIFGLFYCILEKKGGKKLFNKIISILQRIVQNKVISILV